ncbi:hypothetical protein [Clavibacter tessellarius]|uniref:Uncharacterized protein n=1 Tax=Clavibacter tessellarius TaxID=31965 RepID=A0A154UZ18_9MICO|nr:hypothetical protein [Clavibacter michiganensis]KZC94317.1 hypothetical protein AWH51_00075 [Clavibacter michiganensis subsp. tessellarius]
MRDLARWLHPLLLGGAWGSLWAAVTAWRDGPDDAAPFLLGAAVVAGALAVPALAVASRPLVSYFFGSSRRTFTVVLLLVLSVGAPRLILSGEVVVDGLILAAVSVVLAAVAAAAAQRALSRRTPDSPDGLDGA